MDIFFLTLHSDVLLICVLEYDEYIFIVHDTMDEGTVSVMYLYICLFMFILPKVFCFYTLWYK